MHPLGLSRATMAVDEATCNGGAARMDALGVPDLQSAFNDAREAVRVLAILSPT